MEVYSTNTPVVAEGAIRALATQLRLTLVSSSDAHAPGEVGTHYTRLPHCTRNESELLAALKSQPLELFRQNGSGRPRT